MTTRTRRRPWPALPSLAGAVALALAACTTTPVAPIPAPLPEALAWPAAAGQRAFLGLLGEENSGDSLEALTFEPGLRVTSVVPNSPAAAAGVVAGDLLLALDGHEVNDPTTLEALVQRAGAGASATLLVQRADTAFDVPLTLAGGAAPAAAPQARFLLDPQRSRAGWATAPDGVRLVSSAPDGPFPRAGLPPGTTLTALDGQPVVSDRELVRRLQALEAGDEVLVAARLPDGQAIEREVTLHEAPTRLTELGLPFLLHYQAGPDGAAAAFSLIDLWFFELFQYQRDGHERRWVLLELFGWDLFPFATGVGELGA